MGETYGRRREDLMLDDLTPEILANMTESQKINIQMLQAITSVNTRVNDIGHNVTMIRDQVDRHEHLLVTGNGDLPILERLRNNEKFIDGVRYWVRIVIGLLVAQFITFASASVIAYMKFLPVLERLANRP